MKIDFLNILQIQFLNKNCNIHLMSKGELPLGVLKYEMLTNKIKLKYRNNETYY